MSDGLCQCGCGQPAPIAKRTVTSRGRFKGQPMRFIRGHNSVGMNRSKPHKTNRYAVEDRGFVTPCWVWQMKVGRNNGYGYVRVAGRERLAHRHHWEQANGSIPDGLQIDHLCRVRRCVNPDHMELVTPLENTRRSHSMKLTHEEATDIYNRRQRGESIRDIAYVYAVSHALVWLIGLNGPDGPRRPDR